MFIILSIQHLNAGEEDFKKIIGDYLSVSTIKASISQYIYLQNGTMEFYTGTFIASSEGYIRIDYIRPEKQTIIINNTSLYWYYCDRNLVFVSQKNSQGTGSMPVFINSIPAEKFKNLEIMSLGIKIYSLLKQAEVYAIHSRTSPVKLILWIDRESGVVIRKYILDGSNREVIKENYTEHIKVKGIKIPSRIEFRARTAGGIIHTVTQYSNIVINTPVDKDLFRFKITPDMKVRLLSDK